MGLSMQTDRRVLVVAAAGAVPWLVYAVATAANSRGRLPPDDLAARPQAGGWAGGTVLALAVVLLALLAATRPPGWRVPLWSAAMASAAFGAVSLLNPAAPGSAGTAWGAAAVAWSLALLLTGEMSRDRTAAFDLSPGDPRRSFPLPAARKSRWLPPMSTSSPWPPRAMLATDPKLPTASPTSIRSLPRPPHMCSGAFVAVQDVVTRAAPVGASWALRLGDRSIPAEQSATAKAAAINTAMRQGGPTPAHPRTSL